MKISVLMPTYDCPPELFNRSVTSVFEQSHQDVELIIKDGTPNCPANRNKETQDVIDRYADRIVYISSPDGPPAEQAGKFGHNGFYEALNTCARVASGDILTLLCSDDERGPKDTLAFVNSEFERLQPYHEMILLYGWCEWIDKRGNNIVDKRPPAQTFESLLKDYKLYTPALFWTKAVHTNFGYFNEKLAWCADMDFWLRCWRFIHTQHVSRILGRYRVWEISQARANEQNLWKEGLLIQDMHR